METVKMVLAAAALSAAATLTAGGPALAQGTQGTVIEHWGAYGTNAKPHGTQTSPAALTLPGPVKQVGSSNSTQYALLTNGQVWAWGLGNDGQLGDGGTSNSYTSAVQVRFPAGVTIASIPTDVDPYDSAFAVDTTGHVWAWGDNAGGEFCLGNADKHMTPVELPFSHVTTLAGGLNHASYDADGTIYSCGDNHTGALGDGSTNSSRTPVQVTGLDGALVTTLVAAWGDTGALLSNGDYYDWGYNNGGQAGNGNTTPVTVPYRVPLYEPVRQVAQGGSSASNGQTLALLADGSLWAWGNDQYYQLGNGVKRNEESPVQITPPAGVRYAALASGGGTCYAISTSGDVWAWGYNVNGEVGNGSTKTAREPVQVATDATQISATARDVVVATTER
jgi:alpha-tubulin suppressor-like RCC1 family protein